MLATRLNAALAARGIHYGWVMAGLAFLYAVFSSSALGVPAVLIVPMAEEMGWTIGELSAPQGLRFALFGLVAPLAGGLMLRYGPRVMLGVSGVLVLAGLLLTVTMTERWQLWLGLGVVLGVAPGLTAMQLNAVIASRWFAQRRGLVLGMLSGAIATGTLAFMPLAAWLAQHYGWRMGLLPSAVGMAVMLAAFLALAKDRPQDLGLPALGESAMQPAPPPARQNFLAVSLAALRLGAGTRTFWVLAATFAICGMTSYGLTQTHLVPFCGEMGIPLVTASWLLAVIGVFDLVGTIVSGWLSDRYDNRWLLAWYYAFRGVSLIWLVSSDVTLVGLSVFAVLYGLDFIATIPPTVKLNLAAFGREMGPAVFAWVFAAHQLGTGAMAWAAGASRDASGSYLPSFLAAGVLCLMAALACALLRRPPAPAAAASALA